MIAAWMLYSAAVTACLLFAAVALERSVRLAGRPARWVVVGAMVSSAVIPIVVRAIPAAPRSGLAGEVLFSPPMYTLPLTNILPLSTAFRDLDVPLIVCWIGLSVVLSAIVVLTHLQLARRIRRYPAERVGESTVLRSTVLGPAVVGWLRSSIVLPSWADDIGQEQRDIMVLHEREHLRGRDTALLSAALLLVVILPWNLPMWCLLFRLRRAIELDCDQRVLRSGIDVREYGNLLLEVSHRRTLSPLPVIGLALNRSFLAQRVDAMTQHMSRFRYPRALFAVVIGGVFVTIACELPAPAEPDLNVVPIAQEIDAGTTETAAALEVAVEDDSMVVLAIRTEAVELQRARNVLDLYAVANDSTLARIPEEIAERLLSGELLIVAAGEEGEPLMLLRKLRERVEEGLSPIAEKEPVPRR